MKAAYLSHSIFLIPSTSPCLQAWVVDIIFAMVGAGATIASFYACCFSFIATPLIMVFFSLLSRVTLLEMKLAMEPAGGKKN